MRTRSHITTILLAAFACLTLAAGCGRPPEAPPPCDGISRFPTGEPLEVGDVILARSYGLIGAMFANHSLEGGKYSHGAMVYRGEDGRLMMLNYRPTGMETCTPEDFFTRYNRLALVRYDGSLDEAHMPEYLKHCPAPATGKDALSAASRYWLWKNDQQRVPPDYHLDHDEHSAMFCLELTSTVYRDCGLPDPFNRAKKADSDPLLILANRLFKSEVYEIRSPSSALTNEDFYVVSQWLRPEYDLREEALNEEVMAIAVEELLAGWRPRRPSLGGRIKLRQIFALYHVVTKTMFWKPKQDLPSYIDQEVIGNGYIFYSYAKSSKLAARDRMHAETPEVRAGDANAEEVTARVRGIVREEMRKHRRKYMVHTAEPVQEPLDWPLD